jgi:hypothetical protein
MSAVALVDAELERVLEQWGKWHRVGRPEPEGAKSWMGPMLERLSEQPYDPDPDYVPLTMPEEQIERVDSAVRQIGQHSPISRDVLVCYYVRRMSARRLGKHLHCSHTRALELVRQAIGRVDTAIAMWRGASA